MSDQNPGTSDQQPELLTTFEQALRISAYDLARRWIDDPARSTLHRGDPAVQIDELATMTALARWLTNWTPASIHRALSAGATLGQVAAAAGSSRSKVRKLWQEWSDRQQRYNLAPVDEHARVARQIMDDLLNEPELTEYTAPGGAPAVEHPA